MLTLTCFSEKMMISDTWFHAQLAKKKILNGIYYMFLYQSIFLFRTFWQVYFFSFFFNLLQHLKSFEPCIYSILTYFQVPSRTKAVLQQKPGEKIESTIAELQIKFRQQEDQMADLQRQTSKKMIIFKVSFNSYHTMGKFNQ